jgi:hypothetical protein
MSEKSSKRKTTNFFWKNSNNLNLTAGDWKEVCLKERGPKTVNVTYYSESTKKTAKEEEKAIIKNLRAEEILPSIDIGHLMKHAEFIRIVKSGKNKVSIFCNKSSKLTSKNVFGLEHHFLGKENLVLALEFFDVAYPKILMLCANFNGRSKKLRKNVDFSDLNGVRVVPYKRKGSSINFLLFTTPEIFCANFKKLKEK